MTATLLALFLTVFSTTTLSKTSTGNAKVTRLWFFPRGRMIAKVNIPGLHRHSSTYQVLIPRLVFLDDFEQVKSIGRCLEKDWRLLLANCFPKIMVNILPYFALPGQDPQAATQREKAHKVYDLLKDGSCLGKQVRAAGGHLDTTNLTWISFYLLYLWQKWTIAFLLSVCVILP